VNHLKNQANSIRSRCVRSFVSCTRATDVRNVKDAVLVFFSCVALICLAVGEWHYWPQGLPTSKLEDWRWWDWMWAISIAWLVPVSIVLRVNRWAGRDER
jgi:hypothetical protein